jgi:hypothetical protein
MVTDQYGRKFEKLRVSLINDYNFSYVYCVGEENGQGDQKIMGSSSPEFSLGKGQKTESGRFQIFHLGQHIFS